MNKKQLAAYPQTIADKLVQDNPHINIDEAQMLVGIALKALESKILALATPAKAETSAV